MIVDPLYIAKVTAVMMIIVSIAAGAYEILISVAIKMYENHLKKEFREDDEDEQKRDV